MIFETEEYNGNWYLDVTSVIQVSPIISVDRENEATIYKFEGLMCGGQHSLSFWYNDKATTTIKRNELVKMKKQVYEETVLGQFRR